MGHFRWIRLTAGKRKNHRAQSQVLEFWSAEEDSPPRLADGRGLGPLTKTRGVNKANGPGQPGPFRTWCSSLSISVLVVWKQCQVFSAVSPRKSVKHN